ncbi:MAG: HigA family addiction module antitoxin [Gammaproteobacteria bacterium]
MAKMKPLHPGEVLREDFLKPMDITAYRLAKDIDVPVNRITGIVNEERAISADTALRLSRYFGTSAKVWIGLQADYDLEIAAAENRMALQRISPNA